MLGGRANLRFNEQSGSEQDSDDEEDGEGDSGLRESQNNEQSLKSDDSTD